MAVCLLSDVSCRAWDRQVRSCLEGSLFEPDSDLTKRSCRSRTHRKRPSNQQETLHDDITSRRDRPAPRHLHRRHRRRQRCRARSCDRSRPAPPATSTAIELLSAHGVEQVGIEGSAGWGAHAAIALVAAGFDCSRGPAATFSGAASVASVGQDRRRRRRRRGAGVARRTHPRTGPDAGGV